MGGDGHFGLVPVRPVAEAEFAAEHRVPVVVEVILERVTNVSMGAAADIDDVVEFEELAEHREHAPTAITMSD